MQQTSGLFLFLQFFEPTQFRILSWAFLVHNFLTILFYLNVFFSVACIKRIILQKKCKNKVINIMSMTREYDLNNMTV